MKTDQEKRGSAIPSRDKIASSEAYGPISHEDALNMARIAKDYHPVHLIGDGEVQAHQLELHPLWISGFAAWTLQRMFPGSIPVSLRVDHEFRPHVGDSFSVECNLAQDAIVQFVIRNQRRRTIAQGRAQLTSVGSTDLC